MGYRKLLDSAEIVRGIWKVAEVDRTERSGRLSSRLTGTVAPHDVYAQTGLVIVGGVDTTPAVRRKWLQVEVVSASVVFAPKVRTLFP
jgi:hypothetical protein